MFAKTLALGTFALALTIVPASADALSPDPACALPTGYVYTTYLELAEQLAENVVRCAFEPQPLPAQVGGNQLLVQYGYIQDPAGQDALVVVAKPIQNFPQPPALRAGAALAAPALVAHPGTAEPVSPAVATAPTFVERAESSIVASAELPPMIQPVFPGFVAPLEPVPAPAVEFPAVVATYEPVQMPAPKAAPGAVVSTQLPPQIQPVDPGFRATYEPVPAAGIPTPSVSAFKPASTPVDPRGLVEPAQASDTTNGCDGLVDCIQQQGRTELGAGACAQVYPYSLVCSLPGSAVRTVFFLLGAN